MEKAVSAAEANRNFSRLLQDVRKGKTFVVTSHGKPLAKLVPYEEPADTRRAAWEALMERLKNQPVQDIGPWTREELYED